MRHFQRQSLADSYLLRNCTIWNANAEIKERQTILVKSGIVQKITAEQLSFEGQELDVNGKVLMPAGIDMQVHMRCPGQTQKERPENAIKAAIKGGYLSFLTMPNTQPTMDNVDVLEQAQKEIASVEKEYGFCVFFSAALTKGLKGSELSAFSELKAAGVVALTDDGLGVQDDESMKRAFVEAEKLNLPVLQHAEFIGHGAHLAPGKAQAHYKLSEYPAKAEWAMVERDLELIKQFAPKARYHVLHVSSSKTLDLIRQAKEQGLNVSAEVTPHHLFFNSDEIPVHSEDNQMSFKMNPPLRSAQDQLALQAECFSPSGVIDWVATDHAPHESDLKDPQMGFEQAAFGTTGLQTSLAVLLGFWKKGLLSESRLVEVFSTSPARYLGLDDYGLIAEGMPLRAVIIDPGGENKALRSDELESFSKNNIFIGQSLFSGVQGVLNKNLHFEF